MNKHLKLYFAQNEAEATKKAAEWFSCTENEIFTKPLEDIPEQEEATPDTAEADTAEADVETGATDFPSAEEDAEASLPEYLFLTAFAGDGGVNPAFIDAGINLFFERDGVYLEVCPFVGGGRPVKVDETIEYLNRKAIVQVDMGTALKYINDISCGVRVKIAPAQGERILAEDIVAWYSADEMEGYMRFLPPEEGGEKLTVIKISEKLKQAGIVFGVSPMSLGEASRERAYGKQYTVARGVQPENGQDGEIIYHFERDREVGKPKELEHGRVDYKELYLFENVKKGQLLFTRKPATHGKAGSTVTGRELPAKQGREANLPRVKNVIISADTLTAYAGLAGYIDVTDGVISVSDTLTVKGDCDLSTGNIDFDGKIIIKGAIISGMEVKASGDITVGGVVSNAELISGGNIELKSGIIGSDRAKINAAGSVTAAFIERSEVYAKGDVIADVIMHSRIETGRSIIARGKRGYIVGGKALAGETIIAKVIGAISHVQTDVEVGMIPEKKARVMELREELRLLARDGAKIAQVELYLSHTDTLVITQARKYELTESVLQTKAQTEKMSALYNSEIVELLEEAARTTGGKIHCGTMVYPGTRVTIGTSVYRVEEETQAVTFRFDNNDIVFGPCERFE